MSRSARRRSAAVPAIVLAALLGASPGAATGRSVGLGARSRGPRAGAVHQIVAPPAIYLPLALAGADRLELGPPSWRDDDVRTLIVTDLAELAATFGLSAYEPEMIALRQRLLALAAHDAVAGRIVWDLRTEAGADVAGAYAAWTANTDPARWTSLANALAKALHDWIQVQRRTRYPGLRYIVIVGDDRILPHLRLRIDAPFDRLDDGWVTETAYFAESTVAAGTGIGSALAEDMTLTDDAYGAADPMPWGSAVRALYLPDVAVGRLVERPGAMTAAIDAFLHTDGDLPIERALTACYDFMQDACAVGDGLLAEAGLAEARHRRLVGNDWTVDDLRGALKDGPDLFLFGVHAKHYVHETPNNGILYASELPTLLGMSPQGRVAYGLACHTGLNTPGDHPEPADFPEMLLAAGVSSVASTGWAYGFDGQMQYQERLFAGLTARLAAGDGATLGDALVAAKRDYALAAEDLDHLHAKTLAGTLLYGLPMAHVHVGGGGHAGSRNGGGPTTVWLHLADAVGGQPVDVAGERRQGGVEARPGAAERQRAIGGAEGSGTTAYRARVHVAIAADGEVRVSSSEGSLPTRGEAVPRVQAGAPLQPELRLRLAPIVVGDRVLSPRGIVWLGARYDDIPGIHPSVSPARTLGSAATPRTRRTRFARAGWYPAAVAVLRTLPGATPSDGMLHLTLGQLYVASATQRRYADGDLDAYYADAPDRTAPTIGAVTAVPSGAGIELSSQVDDASGVARVVATWTGGEGRWQHSELEAAGGGRWRTTLPANAMALLQAVDGAGNVAIADGDGRYYGVAESHEPGTGAAATAR